MAAASQRSSAASERGAADSAFDRKHASARQRPLPNTSLRGPTSLFLPCMQAPHEASARAAAAAAAAAASDHRAAGA
jgi:hypothetical protein